MLGKLPLSSQMGISDSLNELPVGSDQSNIHLMRLESTVNHPSMQSSVRKDILPSRIFDYRVENTEVY